MGLFGRSQGDLEQRIAHLELEVTKLASALRQLEGEQLTMHDQVRKWMRRAVAAERNQERLAGPSGEPHSAPPAPPPNLTGARLRIYQRRLARARHQGLEPVAPETEGTNGTDS